MRILLLMVLLCVPLASCYSTQGSFLFQTGPVALNVSGYGDFLYSTPPEALEMNKQGMEAFKAKNYETAATAFSKTLKAFPGNPDATFYFGLSQVGEGKTDAGLATLQGFTDSAHAMQTKTIRWWAAYFQKNKGKSAESIIHTMRRERGDSRKQEMEDDLRFNRL